MAGKEHGRGRIALVRGKGLAGCVLPKGDRPPGEDVDTTARREIAREVRLLRLRRLANLTVLERLGSGWRFWSVIDYGLYTADQISGRTGDPEHHSAMAWFNLDDLAEMFQPDKRKLVETFWDFIRRRVLTAAAVVDLVP